MGTAKIATKLSLAEFARIVGIHPLHFEGVSYTPSNRSAYVCDGGIPQYDWQSSDQVSREQIARAIADAEEMIERYLQFRLVPSWEYEEWQLGGRPYQRELFNIGGRSVGGYRSAVPAKWRKVLSGGVETRTPVRLEAPITWSDENGDGYFETGTVLATVAEGQAPCEIEVYYPGHTGDPAYQIRPATVTVSGTTATIVFRRELAVAEDILEALTPEAAEATDDSDFLTEVDVYRHWNDPSTQATLMWEPGSGCGCFTEGSCAVCSYSVQTACLFLRSTPREAILGWSPGTWDDDGFTALEVPIPRAPDILRLYYHAGNVAPRGCPSTMEPQWALVVARLALSLLDRPTCACTGEVWEWWKQSGAELGKGDAAVRFLSNPFGTSRGALYAWSRVTDPGAAVVRSGVLV